MMQFNFEVEDEDRLSDLPINVIEHILDLMPTEDAARTSVLAKKWRYIWAKHPNLVLDKSTFKKISTTYGFGFHYIIHEILRQHIGNIIKFVVDCSEVSLYSYFYADRWINDAMRNGVRELILNFSNNDIYELPSNLYSYQNLTQLALSNCLFKPPNFIFLYPNLKILYLKHITFEPTNTTYILKFPVLATLIIMYCIGTEFLNIMSPQLKYLLVFESQHLNLNCFMNCSILSTVSLSLHKVLENPKEDERSTLLKLISGLPMLSKLHLDIYYLKFLGEAPNVPRCAPLIQNCLRHIMLTIQLTKLAQVSYALLFIQCFFNLKILQIWVFDTSNGVEDVLNYLEAPHNFDRPLVNMEHITICHFNGTKSELLLIKLLLAASPSLLRMRIERKREFSSIQERNITTELMRYPRASSKAELFYL